MNSLSFLLPHIPIHHLTLTKNFINISQIHFLMYLVPDIILRILILIYGPIHKILEYNSQLIIGQGHAQVECICVLLGEHLHLFNQINQYIIRSQEEINVLILLSQQYFQVIIHLQIINNAGSRTRSPLILVRSRHLAYQCHSRLVKINWNRQLDPFGSTVEIDEYRIIFNIILNTKVMTKNKFMENILESHSKSISMKIPKYQIYKNIISLSYQNMKTNSNEKVFHKETDTFQLTVTFNQKKLRVELKDYVDWTMYEKEYTSRDIGMDIHQKMDLFDVFHAFSLSRSQDNEQNEQQSRENIAKYKFGSVVWHQKLPRYKIDREGRITAYLSILDIKTNKCHIYQSNLRLNYRQNLSKMEVFQKKWVREKIQFINKRQQQQLFLYKNILKLEKANRNLKIGLCLFFFILLLGLIWWIQKSNFYVGKLQKLEEMVKSIRKTVPYTNLPQSNLNYFELDQNRLRYVGANETWSHYIFNNPIFHNQEALFSFKIINTQHRYILIGIVDYVKQKNQRSSWSSENAICYYGYNGYKFPGSGYEGKGFNQGDKVEVFVDRANLHVKYLINGTIIASQFHQILSDSSRVFMPYIDMYHTNDQVEWEMDKVQ